VSVLLVAEKYLRAAGAYGLIATRTLSEFSIWRSSRYEDVSLMVRDAQALSDNATRLDILVLHGASQHSRDSKIEHDDAYKWHGHEGNA